MVLAARILLGGLLGGRGIAVLYSAAGGAACFAGMLLLKRLIPERHLWLASVFGAVLHNIGQMAVAAMIAGTAVLAYLPFLLLRAARRGLSPPVRAAGHPQGALLETVTHEYEEVYTMKVIIVGGVPAARRARRACAGWMRTRRSSSLKSLASSPMPIAACPTTWAGRSRKNRR